MKRALAAVLLLAIAACSTRDHIDVPANPRPALRPAPPPVTPARPACQARKVVADAVATPQGRVHIVKPGETGIAIARAYGIDWGRVVAANHLVPPFTLEVGDKLLLPSKQQVAAMSVEERAKAFRLDIDDLITGGEPAAAKPRPAKSGVDKAVIARPAESRPAPAAALPLPELAGDAPRFAWPVEGRLLSGFGAKPGGRFNDGVNLKASAGGAVRAAGDGVVAYAGDAIPGFGNLLLLKHAGGWVTAYAHNEALLVARGARVRQGDVIARAGQTGAVSEPQLHFELRRGRTPVDPMRVIGGR